MMMSAPQGGAVRIDGSQEMIQMFMSAKGLPNVPTWGTTDPFICVYARNPVTGQLGLVHTTSAQLDNLNPHWSEPCKNVYSFETIQTIVVKMYHKAKGVREGDNMAHTFLGSAEFSQSALMMAPGQKLSLRIADGYGKGVLEVRGEVVANTRNIFRCSIACNNLARKNGLGIFSKSDPFLQIKRTYPDGTRSVVFSTSHITGDLNPFWSDQRIEMTALCNGDVDAELSFELFDYNSNGNHVPMGSVQTTLRSVIEANGNPFTVIERNRVGSFMYKDSGTICLRQPVIEHHPTLVQFLEGGLEVSLVVAIDFTASNGDPNNPKSLHRHSQGNMPPNDYEKAITAVGSVIEAYNLERKFSVYGFGAKLKQPDGTVSATSHCFPVYHGDSTVIGVQGVIQAYRECLSVVDLSGPTHFKQLIENSAYLAQNSNCTQENQKYTVLLILTDGVIDDMEQTIASIVRASHMPLSVIIVGIGNEDFSDMNRLDGDHDLLQHSGVFAARDIVQFVPFKKYHQKGEIELAKHVLAEVPSQILNFMEKQGIKPQNKRPPPPAYEDDF